MDENVFRFDEIFLKLEIEADILPARNVHHTHEIREIFHLLLAIDWPGARYKIFQLNTKAKMESLLPFLFFYYLFFCFLSVYYLNVRHATLKWIDVYR